MTEFGCNYVPHTEYNITSFNDHFTTSLEQLDTYII